MVNLDAIMKQLLSGISS